MEYSEAVVALDILLDKEPANQRLYVSALDYCTDQIDEHQAVEYVESQKSSVTQIQTGESIIAVLIRRGGIERILLVDGEPYEGTLQELQQDDSVDDDAVIESYVQTTQAGMDVIQTYKVRNSLETLFGELPQFVSGFVVVLQQCEDSDGKTTDELQQALIDAGIIAPGNIQSQEIHASYFTSKLERYGALVWDRKRWHTTPKGEGVLK